MENPVYAPEDGVVKEIKVKVGQQVAEGDVLIVLE
jgi:acetyl-CoA carboxylase biotin carboxyl carrier protein